jgi:SAM-dependent methyltransferase
MGNGVLAKYTQSGLAHVSCNLCGADDAELLSRVERFGTGIPTVGCRRCGLIYLDPRWSDESYRAFYEEDYRRLMGEEEDPPREAMFRARVHGAALLAFCADFIKPGARVLDIGCGSGGVLRAFREGRDCRCVGIEPSIEQSAFARNELGLEVVTGILESVELEPESFDLILILQTLNHLLDPAAFLSHAHRLLRPAGQLLIEVQNFPEYAKTTSKACQVDHCYYFSAETLECMLRRRGFEPVCVQIDTAESARLVHPYMWHRSASIHIHSLSARGTPDPKFPLPEPGLALRSIRKTLSRAEANERGGTFWERGRRLGRKFRRGAR